MRRGTPGPDAVARRAAPDQVHATSSRIVERRLAVSWLEGYHELYSEGDTNT